LRYRFESTALATALRDVFGADRTLGSADLRSLLMVTLSNATTDSPWPLSNNPHALYNDRALPDCNLDLPLWQLVRASTAAPTYFPPEVVQIGPSRFVFQDGGVTPYNNPAFLLFLMATTTPYRLEWPTGPKKLLLVSVGSGTVPNECLSLVPKRMNLLYLLGTLPRALMFASLNEQDLMCRLFGETLAGPPLDSETGDLVRPNSRSGLPKLFSYVRYNAELTRRGLDRLGLTTLQPEKLSRIDGVQHIDDLTTVGRAAASGQVQAAHFERHIAPSAEM
jgi:hypothetical protein